MHHCINIDALPVSKKIYWVSIKKIKPPANTHLYTRFIVHSSGTGDTVPLHYICNRFYDCNKLHTKIHISMYTVNINISSPTVNLPHVVKNLVYQHCCYHEGQAKNIKRTQKETQNVYNWHVTIWIKRLLFYLIIDFHLSPLICSFGKIPWRRPFAFLSRIY
jgi:hypothetical protein